MGRWSVNQRAIKSNQLADERQKKRRKKNGIFERRYDGPVRVRQSKEFGWKMISCTFAFDLNQAAAITRKMCLQKRQ